jgi:flagellin-specific chaperone FliS
MNPKEQKLRKIIQEELKIQLKESNYNPLTYIIDRHIAKILDIYDYFNSTILNQEIEKFPNNINEKEVKKILKTAKKQLDIYIATIHKLR